MEAARPDNNTMATNHEGRNDCLNLRPIHETPMNIEEMATKYLDRAIQVCTQPRTSEIGMATLEDPRELNQGLDKLCSRHPEDLELADLRWTKERLRCTFNIQHCKKAACEAVRDQLAKHTRTFLTRGRRENRSTT